VHTLAELYRRPPAIRDTFAGNPLSRVSIPCYLVAGPCPSVVVVVVAYRGNRHLWDGRITSVGIPAVKNEFERKFQNSPRRGSRLLNTVHAIGAAVNTTTRFSETGFHRRKFGPRGGRPTRLTATPVSSSSYTTRRYCVAGPFGVSIVIVIFHVPFRGRRYPIGRERDCVRVCARPRF